MHPTEQIDSLSILSRQHSGSLLPLSATAQEIGINLRTAHNQISKGIFPIPTILRDRRRYVYISELASLTLIDFANVDRYEWGKLRDFYREPLIFLIVGTEY